MQRIHQHALVAADVDDVKEAEERSVADGIVALVAERQVLLVLDNLEQIVSAAPEVAELVARCPKLRIVVTSRTPLRCAIRSPCFAMMSAVARPTVPKPTIPTRTWFIVITRTISVCSATCYSWGFGPPGLRNSR